MCIFRLFSIIIYSIDCSKYEIRNSDFEFRGRLYKYFFPSATPDGNPTDIAGKQYEEISINKSFKDITE